jgi:uncharacterized protein (UPF0332 family)
MNLSDLLRDEKIRKITPDAKQSADCIVSAERDIKAAKAMLPSDCDWAFSIAYNSMLQSARALMFADGYRAAGEDQHKAAIEYADVKLGTKMQAEIEAFERARVRRHRVVYDESGLISHYEADLAIENAEKMFSAVKLKLGQK